MKAHELAQKLLAGPDLPIIVSIWDNCGVGEVQEVNTPEFREYIQADLPGSVVAHGQAIELCAYYQ